MVVGRSATQPMFAVRSATIHNLIFGCGMIWFVTNFRRVDSIVVRLCLFVFVVLFNASLLVAGDSIPADRDRSPVDLVLARDASWLVTANQTSDSISLVRVGDGKVLTEVSVGRRPVAVTL